MSTASVDDTRALIEELRIEIQTNPKAIYEPRFLDAMVLWQSMDPADYDLLKRKVSKATGIGTRAIDKHVDKRLADLIQEPASSPQAPPELRHEAEALELLRSGRLKEEFLSGIRPHPFRREAAEVTLHSIVSAAMGPGYLFHDDVNGPPEAQKSYTTMCCFWQFPQELVKVFTNVTPQAFIYAAKQGALDNVIAVYLDDATDAHIPILKTFRNDGRVTPRSGTVINQEYVELAVTRRFALSTSSVNPLKDFEDQLPSRTFMKSLPALTPAQQSEIKADMQHRIGLGALTRQETDHSLEVIRDALSILIDQGIKEVLVPFRYDAPEKTTLRGAGMFFRMVTASAFLNQYQRPLLTREDGTQYVLAIYEDLEVAARLWFAFQDNQKYKINERQLKVLRLLPDSEPGFTPQKIHELSEIPESTCKLYLNKLYYCGLANCKQQDGRGRPFGYWVDKALAEELAIESTDLVNLANSSYPRGLAEFLEKNSPTALHSSIYNILSYTIQVRETDKLNFLDRGESGNNIISLFQEIFLARTKNTPGDADYSSYRPFSSVEPEAADSDPEISSVVSSEDEGAEAAAPSVFEMEFPVEAIV